MNVSFVLRLATFRTRASGWVTRTRPCVRCVLCSPAFLLVPPLTPPAPLPMSRHCSSASRLLRRSQTSHGRASSASAPRLPDADRSSARYERCRSAVGPPDSRTRSFCTCQGLRPRRIVRALAYGAPVPVAFHIRNCVGTRDDRSFAVQWLTCSLPYRRFALDLADDGARLRADVACYSFTVRDLHPL